MRMVYILSYLFGYTITISRVQTDVLVSVSIHSTTMATRRNTTAGLGITKEETSYHEGVSPVEYIFYPWFAKSYGTEKFYALFKHSCSNNYDEAHKTEIILGLL